MKMEAERNQRLAEKSEAEEILHTRRYLGGGKSLKTRCNTSGNTTHRCSTEGALPERNELMVRALRSYQKSS
jgi:hypothetical protein